MVFIISESSDISTNHVIDWIVSFGYPFIRINPNDEIEILELGLSDFKLLINKNKIISYSEITSIWFRRGELNVHSPSIKSKSEDGFANYIRQHLKAENKAYIDFIYHLLKLKRHIGAIDTMHINKFIVLRTALECGLDIPETFCTSNKKRLINLTKAKGALITKSSNYVFNFTYAEENYMTYTEKLKDEIIQDLPSNFFLSLCQVLVNKRCDIRVFYLNGACFSMAILSQNDIQTKVDFRKYNYESLNRWIPFQLPDDLRLKIIQLMGRLDLISGSIDFILDDKGQYIFLEVNPVGQFGMVDFPCNYSINEQIAKYLVFN